MSNRERANRLVGDMPWVTRHMAFDKIQDLISQIETSMDEACRERDNEIAELETRLMNATNPN